jgi:Cu/Ag efflux pump CusA
VVMGGLVSSTALTLLMLPALYAWKERASSRAAP